MISKREVEADEDKIKKKINWPPPTNVSGLQGFLGLTGYYRRFVKDYGEIAAPLTKLLQKNAFKWNEEANTAFENLKLAMTTLQVLALPDWNIPFTIETDASDVGLGAVISQNGNLIAFFSQKLSTRAQNKSIYERELMAVVLSVQKWRHYLLAKKFSIISNQKALKFLLEQREVQSQFQNKAGVQNKEQFQKQLTKLLGYDFEILYQPGLQNKAADALSRMDQLVELHNLTTTGIIDVRLIEQEVENDAELKKIIENLKKNANEGSKFQVEKGRLLYKGRMC